LIVDLAIKNGDFPVRYVIKRVSEVESHYHPIINPLLTHYLPEGTQKNWVHLHLPPPQPQSPQPVHPPPAMQPTSGMVGAPSPKPGLPINTPALPGWCYRKLGGAWGVVVFQQNYAAFSMTNCNLTIKNRDWTMKHAAFTNKDETHPTWWCYHHHSDFIMSTCGSTIIWTIETKMLIWPNNKYPWKKPIVVINEINIHHWWSVVCCSSPHLWNWSVGIGGHISHPQINAWNTMIFLSGYSTDHHKRWFPKKLMVNKP
jgi:hypothetical protein